MLETTYKTQVIELFKGIKKHDEFEVMFNNYKVASNTIKIGRAADTTIFENCCRDIFKV